MDKKIILITGANKGIGFEIVRQLAELGHQVILTARDEAKGEKAIETLRASNLVARFILLDVTNEASIQQAAREVQTLFGHIDVLINNAAILLKDDRQIHQDPTIVFNKTMQTNVYGPLLVSKQFVSLMPRGSKIIMTSSQGGSMSDPVGGWSPAYCVSKSSLNAVTRHLASELSSSGISVNAFDPGWVKTDMGGQSAPRSVKHGADTAVWLATTENTSTGKFFRDRKPMPW